MRRYKSHLCVCTHHHIGWSKRTSSVVQQINRAKKTKGHQISKPSILLTETRLLQQNLKTNYTMTRREVNEKYVRVRNEFDIEKREVIMRRTRTFGENFRIPTTIEKNEEHRNLMIMAVREGVCVYREATYYPHTSVWLLKRKKHVVGR